MEASFRTIKEGDVVKGTVIDVNEEEVTLDLKYYAQGIIKAEDMSADPSFSLLQDVKEGEELEAVVVSMDDGQGNILLSRKEANETLGWDVLQNDLEERRTFRKGNRSSQWRSSSVCRGNTGLYPGIPAGPFLCGGSFSEYVGKKLTVRVITVDKEKEKLVLSAKEILREQEKEAHDHKVAMIVPGTVLEGTVESLQPYGAFVDLKDGLSGLVHISQICQRRIKKPSEVLKVGDKVKVKVLNTNEGKISLSIKAAQELEAEEVESFDTASFSNREEVGTSLGDLFKKLGL